MAQASCRWDQHGTTLQYLSLGTAAAMPTMLTHASIKDMSLLQDLYALQQQIKWGLAGTGLSDPHIDVTSCIV